MKVPCGVLRRTQRAEPSAGGTMDKGKNGKLLFAHLNKRTYISKVEEISKTKGCTVKKNKFRNIYVDFSLNKYININSLDVGKFIKTPIHYQTFRELVDTIKNVSDVRLQNIHLVRKIVNSIGVYITNYLNNVSQLNHLTNLNTSNGGVNLQDNFYDLDNCDEDENAITPNSITTILISLYKLKYRNEKFLQLLERLIFVKKDNFKFSQLNLILYIYAYFNRVNKKFINSLLMNILDNEQKLNADNILSIFTSLFYLNCKNEKTLDRLANYIISNHLQFDIHVIIFLLNNLRKMNYSNSNSLMEYFHDQIILKLGFLPPGRTEKEKKIIDRFFLKRKIQLIIDEENLQEGGYPVGWKDGDTEQGSHHDIAHLKDEKKGNITCSYYPPVGKIDPSYNLCEEHIMNTYGSVHNKYIVENNYVDYIYEYYNEKDLEEGSKSKLDILMEVLIYNKHFKEDLLTVLYEYLLNNLKSFMNQNDSDMCRMLSNMYYFQINNFPKVLLLNKKIFLSMCHHYVPFYKRTNIMIFLYIKLLLHKYNYFDVFIDTILQKKIQTDLLTLEGREFLNLLIQCKNYSVSKYLCDISLVYFDFFSVKYSPHGVEDERNTLDKYQRSNHHEFSLSQVINTHKDGKNKRFITLKFNEKNKLSSYDGQFLLQLLHFYIEMKYYEGIFLFLKSLFSGVRDFQKFDPYVYYKINNHIVDMAAMKQVQQVQRSDVYVRFNALQIIHLYEYFKSAFASNEDFITQQDNVKKAKHEKALYHHFYAFSGDNSGDGSVDDVSSRTPIQTKQGKQPLPCENKTQASPVSKYLFTDWKVNYISANNANATSKRESNGTFGNVIDGGRNNGAIPLEKKKYNSKLPKSGELKNEHDKRNGNMVQDATIQIEGNTFYVDNHVYNVLNNIFLYTPVDLFALYIHHFNSKNIFFLLQNIIFKLNWVNVEYLSLVVAKIFARISEETCRETKKDYMVYLDFFHDYLLGEEGSSQKFSYQSKQTRSTQNVSYLNGQDKRLLISRIHQNCITTCKDQDKVKKRIAYILCKNKSYSGYINNAIIFDEKFLSLFVQLAFRKKNNFSSCSYYDMMNDSLLLILKSLRTRKKNPKYMQSVEIITNIFLFRYIQYKYSEEANEGNLSKRCASEKVPFLDPPMVDMQRGERGLCLNLDLDVNSDEKLYSHLYCNLSKRGPQGEATPVQQNEQRGNITHDNVVQAPGESQRIVSIPNATEKYTQKGASNTPSSVDEGNLNGENQMTKRKDALMRYIRIYYTIVKVRYFHEMSINKHIFRELCLNREYIDNAILLDLLFYIYKYKFDEMRYILLLQKKCTLYKDLYYTHSNCRIVEFLCKKLKINLDDSVRTIPTKQTSYDYENV
ncbi:conserved Plasmodium protein, unknown function [Plasmodium knowlesi strain H]|uniref:Uncharacterized protein n=3 Tax=Plasmodium knowlesi TaxID=5850 RepID=A0A5K1TYN5_PLAKH|nr:conserved Plasmodium protein, unknown function [Plasmodium knowlesi strain H]OTN64298.1 Uncharacterized protein PKNOH_S140226100 [Plasmodium knowlesi]CAA9990689.1 conserved Plasmodium protein, unknown function [Plasmodium knowlesi strain H]SBO25919.1 conserved Plasmodium protein, unknown function [Plasmodium knowlesi strain H]SBO28669.1 conserved Plasmodium protein, unknown function [Plasmodium knowlesi strain H]VVS80163.1 conserved Plasmodium protein, unknown function [Plasmodium knowlesi |eukprot:XP_002261979.1 hypothetical protein, conserved in Plasmodium species [Plasmodium knowlesi strain H]